MVDNMSVMVRFYHDVLGFEIREDENASNVFLEKDGTLFLLYRKSDFDKMTGRSFSYAKGINGHYEIALSVSNYSKVDKTFETLVKSGVQAVMSPTAEACGQRTCYIADLEGNLVEIGSFTEG